MNILYFGTIAVLVAFLLSIDSRFPVYLYALSASMIGISLLSNYMIARPLARTSDMKEQMFHLVNAAGSIGLFLILAVKFYVVYFR